MTPAARLSAAIEVLADIQSRRRPASDALKDWGLAHRFAGSKDRAAIASLTYDALRRQASAAFIMGEETPRAILFGALALQRGMDAEALGALCDGSRFAPAPLTDEERARLSRPDLSAAPDHVRADAPDWLWPRFAEAYGEQAVAEVTALSGRAPVDIRVNSLKTLRDIIRPKLAHLNPVDTPGHPSACVLTLARAEGARRSRRCRNSSKGSLRFRMKAPSLSRRCRASSPACR